MIELPTFLIIAVQKAGTTSIYNGSMSVLQVSRIHPPQSPLIKGGSHCPLPLARGGLGWGLLHVTCSH